MNLDYRDLTKAQLRAVRWLRKQHGKIIVPPIHKGDVYEMHGTTRSKSREPIKSFVWRVTYKALFARGWLSMDGPNAWKLSPGATAELERAHFETEGFTKEEA